MASAGQPMSSTDEMVRDGLSPEMLVIAQVLGNSYRYDHSKSEAALMVCNIADALWNMPGFDPNLFHLAVQRYAQRNPVGTDGIPEWVRTAATAFGSVSPRVQQQFNG